MRNGVKRNRASSIDTVNGELAALPTRPRTDLVAHWTAAYGNPPPKGISRRLLEYAVAYHVQVEAHGGLGSAVRRKLHQAASTTGNLNVRAPRASVSKTAPPGSRLVREWHGRTYTADVVPDGVLYDGRQYRSLSEVARAITGTRWSGPRFFGL